MKREEIIQKFMDMGYQLTAEALNYLVENPNLSSNFVEIIKNSRPKDFIIDKKTIDKIITSPLKIKILKTKITDTKTLNIQNFIGFLNQRYVEIKKIISENEELKNLVSIGKISPKTKEFSIIGLILEKNVSEKTVLIEDESGKIKIYFEDYQIEDLNELVEDEVVGLINEVKDDKITVKKTIFPDISLKKEITKTVDDVFCVFVSDFHMNNEKFNQESYKKFLTWIKEQNGKKLFIFILGDISKNREDIEEFSKNVTNNTKIFIKGEIDPDTNLFDMNFTNETLAQIGNVTIFLQHGETLDNYRRVWNTETEKIILKLLKKRHLNPIFEFNKRLYDDIYFLKETPDIIASGHTHLPGAINYKGVTIISNGSFVTTPIFFMVNLKTRELIKLDFT